MFPQVDLVDCVW